MGVVDTGAAEPRTSLHHPLDPLSSEEVTSAVAITRADGRFREVAAHTRFVSVSLHEPAKESVLAGGVSPREAFIILLDRARETTYELVVSLTSQSVASWREVRGIQPAFLMSEEVACEQAVKNDPRFLEAMSKRGLTDLSDVIIDPVPAGNFGYPDEEGLRLARATAYLRRSPDDNWWAHPIGGVVALVDLHKMQVLNVEDRGVVPIPPESGNYDVASAAPPRSDLKALEITQPDGPSFTVRGWQVEWQRWHIHVGFTPREGLVLHTVGYEDGGRVRPILYRAAVSEMVVPYGDPSRSHYFRSFFDAGENGIGASANSLTRGCDCLGEIYYFDAALADDVGELVELPHAICMHEEDYGVLWRHSDWRTDRTEVRRSRRLVISSFSTIGNYDYGFFWYFYQDGTIQFEVKLTGILQMGAISSDEIPQHGTLVAPGLNAMYHQHYFNLRLDMDIDGTANSVYEVHSESVPPGPENPFGNAFVARRTLLSTEQEARQLIDPLAARSWEIVNPAVQNGLGRPVAYRLIPGDNVVPFAQPDSAVIKRAGFITSHLWVTPYTPGERYAAGDYPSQHPGGAGLPEYVAADRAIDNTDVVVWYTFGHHHIPRPEDWPIMPAAYAGFLLKPFGFFDRNPSLDVPPPTACHNSCHE
ncbi:MAG TPA: primary-amine oxidase [Chloroflexota bacterium]|nr:primary-amine oxidase [Chloroflexota bacterium]